MDRYPALYIVLVFAVLIYAFTNIVSIVFDLSMIHDINEQRSVVVGCDEDV